jgi:hypothetical protein
MIEPQGYNERLFSGKSLRFAYHTARYHWLASEIRKLAIGKARIVELGCFDAKTLDFISFTQPSYYLGLDAGWENGLRQGRERWKDREWVELLQCTSPGEMPDRGSFDVGICLETLHVMDYEIEDAYLRRLSEICAKLFVTVPREHGLVFFAKHAAKSMLYGRPRIPYSWREVVLLTLGQFDKVERQEYKGFDERVLLRIMSRYFKVERVCGLFPSTAFPVGLSCTIGVAASSKVTRRG